MGKLRRRESLRVSNYGCLLYFVSAIAILTFWSAVGAQEPTFRNAPASATEMKNPYAGNAGAAAAGKKLYAQNCSQCHGRNREGMGPAPALDSAAVQKAKPGELFWFVTNGKPASGMPVWTNLPKSQRWELVTYLQTKEKSAGK